MGVTLYHFAPSGPSRGALLAAKAIGLDVDIQVINLFRKEQFNEDFIKINPQHTIPTLVDDDFVLWDSHAIGPYLATVYGKDPHFYPKDPKERAIVDQRLYFDCGEDQILDEHKQPLEEALGFLDVFLEGNDFVTGNNLTVADCSIIASVTSIMAIGWDISAYGNVKNWVARCALAIPGYAEANQGAEEFGKAVRSKLAPGQL